MDGCLTGAACPDCCVALTLADPDIEGAILQCPKCGELFGCDDLEEQWEEKP